jgi:glutamate--cysteine ligase/glutathione synthase
MNFIQPGYKDFELSTQIIINEAIKRNVTVDVLDRKDNFILLKNDKKIEYIKQATRTSLDTYIAPLMMENKLVTKKILSKEEISVPNGKTFNSIEGAKDSFIDFYKKDIVIKPNSTNFGKAVSIIKHNQSKDEFNHALVNAFKFDQTVIIEEFLKGKEYRFLIIGEEVAAVLHRIPANVTGDGFSPIKELVKIKNQNPLRGKGYKTPLEQITLGEIEKDFLKNKGLNFESIPKKGETVFLRENSNISTGGDSIDYTDEVLDEYNKIALNAAYAVGAKICGADLIIKNIKEKPDNHNYGVIELNFNPALHIHNYPYRGKNRETGKKILDLLGF